MSSSERVPNVGAALALAGAVLARRAVEAGGQDGAVAIVDWDWVRDTLYQDEKRVKRERAERGYECRTLDIVDIQVGRHGITEGRATICS